MMRFIAVKPKELLSFFFRLRIDEWWDNSWRCKMCSIRILRLMLTAF